VKEFDWSLHEEAESYLRSLVDRFLRRHAIASGLASMIESATSTYFVDWVDHMVLPEEWIDEAKLASLGFKARTDLDGTKVHGVDGSVLFPLTVGPTHQIHLVIKVEDMSRFVEAHRLTGQVEGSPGEAYRCLPLKEENGLVLCAAERRGPPGFKTGISDDGPAYWRALDAFKGRRRRFEKAEEGVEALKTIISASLEDLEAPRVADAFFRAERQFWQSRNIAGQVQAARQDSLGLGWANHDHHTFRSSRGSFASLIEVLEMMGFRPRERYHAGAKAGWGAQIMEQPVQGTVVFTDVDLGQEETRGDFAHEGLSPKEGLGTVGMWVELHGESMLEAGLHHLAARFRFDDLTSDIKARGVEMMKPFSDFPFLRQAFTKGERWMPIEGNVPRLVGRGAITSDQAATFLTERAIGSHLENIQRGQGFKGFNQDSVSAIIRATDPRGKEAGGA
jgi:hypothetical protein